MEAPNAEFDMVSYSAQAYSAGMKEIAPDLPLLQVPDPEAMENAMALELFEMTFSMEGLSATGHDSGGVLSGGQGAGTEQTIQEPIVITVDGATVYVTFPKHGFERAFKGTIVGNVN
jgi:hypothetical protein